MSDTLMQLLTHVENAEKELAEAKRLTMHLFVELADKGHIVHIPHATLSTTLVRLPALDHDPIAPALTHSVVVPRGAFCCDTAEDQPEDA